MPTLRQGDIVIAKKSIYVSPGDVVIAIQSGREVIKRVDEISDKGIYIVGDNTSHSTDSRHYGAINAENVIGVVLFALPFKKLAKH